MRIIPAIDIIDGKCVRLTQGDYAQKKVYSENPLDVAQGFETAGIKYLHLVDLDGAKAGKVINWNVIESICQHTTLSVDFGGGIKTKADIQRLFELGVKQVNLGSIAVKQPQLVYDWMNEFTPSKIILSADVKEEQVAISGWQEDAAINLFDFIEQYSKQGLEYVVCTDIQTDGTLKGPNIDLYKKIQHRFPLLKLVASGGVGSLLDVQELNAIDVDGVIVGKAIYEGKIKLEELTR